MARPKRQVDTSRIEELISNGCSDNEIAVITGVPQTVLCKKYATLLRKKRELRKSELRAKQMSLALAGDRTMLIWLGKNMIGQSDRADITSAGEALKVIVERIG